MLLCNVKLCLWHSEIIHSVDSEITAVTAVVMKNGSPKGCGIPSLRAKCSNFTDSHELISPGARRISLCPNGQNFTSDTQ